MMNLVPEKLEGLTLEDLHVVAEKMSAPRYSYIEVEHQKSSNDAF